MCACLDSVAVHAHTACVLSQLFCDVCRGAQKDYSTPLLIPVVDVPEDEVTKVNSINSNAITVVQLADIDSVLEGDTDDDNEEGDDGVALEPETPDEFPDARP